MYQDYEKMKNDLQNQLQSYQYSTEMYDFKKLNNEEEAENIFVMRNTIFLGNNRMQIKKLDGTIEKYKVEKYYPIDEKDQMIKELNKKVEDLERRLNDEHTKYNQSNSGINKPDGDDDEHVEPESKAIVESVPSEE